MYRDLAHAIEDLKKKKFRNLTEDETYGKFIRKGEFPPEFRQINIDNIFRFDEGTDPGDESTLYTLKLPDGGKGFLVLSFGMYKDPTKSELIDELKKLENK